jgi:hypothetical protein
VYVSKVLIGCGVVVCGGDLWLMTAEVVEFDIFCLHFDHLRIPSKLHQQNSAYNAKIVRNLRNCDSNLTRIKFGHASSLNFSVYLSCCESDKTYVPIPVYKNEQRKD